MDATGRAEQRPEVGAEAYRLLFEHAREMACTLDLNGRFTAVNRAGERLVENRMLVIEMVFGFLLAALAVQLALNGLADVGVITLDGH